MHYKRLWRTGSLQTTRSEANLRPQEKLLLGAWTVTEDSCWEWSKSRNSKGYGVLYTCGKTYPVYRVAYEAWVGPIPEGQLVRHKCDNPPCINPDHLELGTIAENGWDMADRRRFYSKLTQDQVDAIRTTYYNGGTTQQALADHYGVTQGAISRVVNDRSWKESYAHNT